MIKCCYLLKIKTKGHKINILIQIKGIGGYPFITRFKTSSQLVTFILILLMYWRLSIYNKV